MVGVTAVVRLDAVAEPDGKRRDDPLDRPELLVSELRPVLHVLAGDRASFHRFGESRGRRQGSERADAVQDGLRALGKCLIPNLEVAGGRQPTRVAEESLDRSHPVLRRNSFGLRPVFCECSRSPVIAPPEREVGPPVDGEERRYDRTRIADHVQKQGVREDRVQVGDASAVSSVLVDETTPTLVPDMSSHEVSHPLRVFGVGVYRGERGVAMPRILRAAAIPQIVPFDRYGREPGRRATDRAYVPEPGESLELREGGPALGVVREPREVRMLAEELVDDRRSRSPTANDEERQSQVVNPQRSTSGRDDC